MEKDKKSSSRKRNRHTLEDEARKQLEDEAKARARDEQTVFVTRIHPKVDERDLFEYFSACGKVNDVRLIRDTKTDRSKGIAYIEFDIKESVLIAIALNGQQLSGYPISVELTQAEKNRVQATPVQDAPMMIFFGNIHSDIAEKDLKPIFSAFGSISSIEISRTPEGESKGCGFVEFLKSSEAREALSSLNGLELAGNKMAVTTIQLASSLLGNASSLLGNGNEKPVIPINPLYNLNTKDDSSMGEIDADGTGGLGLNANSRAMLMQKLQNRGSDGDINDVAMQIQLSTLPNIPQPKTTPTTPILIQPTSCILLKNMFDPASETEEDFHLDIEEDVGEECKKYGDIKHIHVDKDSQGHVFIRFRTIESSKQAFQALNGRWFASRQIQAEYISETVYEAKFPDSRS